MRVFLYNFPNDERFAFGQNSWKIVSVVIKSMGVLLWACGSFHCLEFVHHLIGLRECVLAVDWLPECMYIIHWHGRRHGESTPPCTITFTPFLLYNNPQMVLLRGNL